MILIKERQIIVMFSDINLWFYNLIDIEMKMMSQMFVYKILVIKSYKTESNGLKVIKFGANKVFKKAQIDKSNWLNLMIMIIYDFKIKRIFCSKVLDEITTYPEFNLYGIPLLILLDFNDDDNIGPYADVDTIVNKNTVHHNCSQQQVYDYYKVRLWGFYSVKTRSIQR